MHFRTKTATSVKIPSWVKMVFWFFTILFFLLLVSYVSITWYINSNKKEVLFKITTTINENLSGNIQIEDMEPTFLTGFPRVSLRLKNVSIKDSLYNNHKHTLLHAKDFDISVNVFALLRGTIEINKITINNAAINLFTDVIGYANTSVFKKSEGEPSTSGGVFPELKEIVFNNINFTINNLNKKKLYKFNIYRLQGFINYKSSGWQANVKLKTLVESMAFNTERGSFLKNKIVEGKFDIAYNDDQKIITFKKNKLEIGEQNFKVGASFKTGGNTADFSINIENDKILWKNASQLLSSNISSKLDMFNLEKPIAVKCDLIGDFNKEGDPLIRVNVSAKNNVLSTPGGKVTSCKFTGVFTNNYIKEKGFNDPNSAIKLYNFTGNYYDIPFKMSRAFILDLEKPIVVGNFKSDFEIAKLKNIIDDDLLKFSNGKANVELNYTADIIDFKLAKPLVSGIVNVKNADINYVPRNLKFKDVSVSLNFTKDDLYISKIYLKTGKSAVAMEGEVKNFLNLYYTNPEKIVLTWNIHSPQLHLGEFIGFLGNRNKNKKVVTQASTGNFTEELNLLFEKSNVDMKLNVDKLFYNKFLATNVKANVLLLSSGIVLKNAGLKHAGGMLDLKGNLKQNGKTNIYSLNATVNNVDISKFFYAFDNFGLQSLKADNLKGYLSSKAWVSGDITDAGTMVPNSMRGTVSFGLKKGELIQFDPVKNVGKLAFPFRKMDTISFYNLNGKFDIKGEKVTIHPMQINSSVLNMNIDGVYSFGKGTSIAVAVPLRNPKKDKKITDKDELAKRRNRGIILRLIAEDDTDGKVKVKLGTRKKAS